MYKLPWVEDSCLSHTCFLSVRTFSVIVLLVTFCAVKRHHDKDKRKHLVGVLFAVAEVEPMAIMVGNMAQAGRHGAEAIAESLLQIYKQEAERDRNRLGLLAFLSSKSTPVTYLFQAS